MVISLATDIAQVKALLQQGKKLEVKILLRKNETLFQDVEGDIQRLSIRLTEIRSMISYTMRFIEKPKSFGNEATVNSLITKSLDDLDKKRRDLRTMIITAEQSLARLQS